MPFGHGKVQVELMLRDAIFANEILCNSEAWHDIKKKHIGEFEIMDRFLLEYMLNAHLKVKNNLLYL